MTDKDRLEACMDQAKFFSQKVYNRQAYQWKVTLGLWTFIAVAVNFLWAKPAQISMWYGVAVLFLYGAFWLRTIAIRNFDDQNAVHHFRDHAEVLLRESSHSIPPGPERSTYKNSAWWIEFLRNPFHLFEFLTTAVFICLAYRLLSPK